VTLLATGLYEWIALHRVNGDGVASWGDCWLDSGHRIPGYVTEALTELLAGGLIVLADQDPYGMRRAALTESGTVRYEWLVSNNRWPCRCPHPVRHRLSAGWCERSSLYDTLAP